MSYAETQAEIISAQLRGGTSAGARVTSIPTAPSPRLLRTVPSPADRPAARERVAFVDPAAPPADAPRRDDDAEADLAAAVAAARRLRVTAGVRQIVDAAGITSEQLRGHDRRRELVEVRRIVAAYLRRRGCSLPEIGRVLNRDHTSVLNLLRTRAPVVDPLAELAS